MDLDLGLDGNVALVTGSATGLGHACAEALSRRGVNVVLASPDLGDLAYATDRLHALGDGEIFSLEADVRDPDQVTALVEETVDQYGGIDHLVTGPGPLEPGGSAGASDEDWFRAFDRLFMSVVWTVREAHPYLETSPHGTMVNVTTPVIPALEPEFAVANAFGRAVEGLTESGARAFAPAVRVNSVVPGPHETENLEGYLAGQVDRDRYPDLESAWAAALEDCSADAPGDPLKLGTIVSVLSSEHASFVNGATIPVDGRMGL